MSFRSPEGAFPGMEMLFTDACRSGNVARIVLLGNERVVIKIYGAKQPRHIYSLRLFLHRMGLRQPFEYRSPKERCDFERAAIEHWKRSGYNVPEIVPSPFADRTPVPHLITQWISGETLGQMLTGEADSSAKLAILERLFAETETRHTRAIAQHDATLCHVDANARNIIVGEHGFYHVDFEMGRPWEPAGTWACREILKLLVSLCETVIPRERAHVLALFQRNYRLGAVLDEIRRSVTARPFQTFHRWQNRRKKEKNPRRVTLYEIIDTL